MTSVGNANGIHAYPRKDSMRLTYNYTKDDYALHPEQHTDKVVSLVKDINDYTETYDITHWVFDDVLAFEALASADRVGLMEGLTKVA